MSLRTILATTSLFGFLLLPNVVFAATLYIDPSISTYGPGDTFIATVRLDNGNDCINAVNVEIGYPTNTLRAVDFSRGDSIFSLWAIEPRIDTDAGTIVFAGGIPGGYCGRIAGDAALSNILGSVVFTVVGTKTPTAAIHFLPASAAYLNDGQGNPADLTTQDAKITLVPTAQLTANPWLAKVGDDSTPPQPFDVAVESTSGVFGGRYYMVFSTTDKESGLDHFEVYEHGAWRHVTSPHVLENQSLLGVGDIQVRALDKAGNVRLGTYSASSTPQRQYSNEDFYLFILLALLFIFFGVKAHFDHKKTPPETPAV